MNDEGGGKERKAPRGPGQRRLEHDPGGAARERLETRVRLIFSLAGSTATGTGHGQSNRQTGLGSGQGPKRCLFQARQRRTARPTAWGRRLDVARDARRERRSGPLLSIWTGGIINNPPRSGPWGTRRSVPSGSGTGGRPRHRGLDCDVQARVYGAPSNWPPPGEHATVHCPLARTMRLRKRW